MRERGRFSLQNCGVGIAGCFALEWFLTRYHFIEDHSETPDICAGIDFRSSGLLRRHIGGRSHHRARLRLNDRSGSRVAVDFVGAPALGKFGQTKVEHLRNAVTAHHDVVRLNIPMNDSGRMRARQRRGHLQRNLYRFIYGQRRMHHMLTQRFAIDEFSSDKVGARFGANFVDSENVRVI